MSGKSDWVPKPGQWPVDPQEDVPISEERIWVDGCFDFSHHGHAGAMLQSRQLGNELLVGIHSDEAIMDNKGPTVMTLKERVAAVAACRWATKPIPHAPYVTQLSWISHYGCKYVVHGDDITSDSNGEDCYRHVKAAGRFKVVKRTPGISTTDLVGRMLLCTRGHFIRDLEAVLEGKEGSGGDEEKKKEGAEKKKRIEDYATDETGLARGPEVWVWRPQKGSSAAIRRTSTSSSTRSSREIAHHAKDEKGTCHLMVPGKAARPGQRVVYVDGGFDLFSSGHIEFLRSVSEMEEKLARQNGWYDDAARERRIQEQGEDYGPAYVIAGVHDDLVINYWRGVNYPIMNIFERGLCVLQCKYIHAVIFSAPFTPSHSFLHSLPHSLPHVVYHGPTSFMPLSYDPYVAAKDLGIFQEIPSHDFQHVNAGEIVERIMKSRAQYEARQRAKGEKGMGEDAIKKREELEREAKMRSVERLYGA